MNSSAKPLWLGFAMAFYSITLLLLVGCLSHYPQNRAAENIPPSLMTLSAPSTEPPDFQAISDTKARKAAFFAFLRPMIAHENSLITQKRHALLSLKKKLTQATSLSAREQQLVAQWAEQFDVPATPLKAAVAELEPRINVIPEALILAQAASESAWGTSRFAREGNNYFGQWCFSKGCGLVPKQRKTGAIHEVAKFKNAQASVHAYFNNLNSFRAYKSLRDIRQTLSVNDHPIKAKALLPGLRHYSERGDAYLKEINAIINHNHLE